MKNLHCNCTLIPVGNRICRIARIQCYSLKKGWCFRTNGDEPKLSQSLSNVALQKDICVVFGFI